MNLDESVIRGGYQDIGVRDGGQGGDPVLFVRVCESVSWLGLVHCPETDRPVFTASREGVLVQPCHAVCYQIIIIIYYWSEATYTVKVQMFCPLTYID